MVSNERLRERPAVRAFLISFVVCFAAMVCWSLATPVFAGPDEPDHIMKAAAVDRGELLGTFQGPPSAYGLVTLPKFYAVDRKIPACYQHNSPQPANCAPSARDLADAPVTPGGIRSCVGQNSCVTNIYDARYPPLYYAVVGLPTLLGTGNWVIYLMRWLSAALCSVFIALGVASVIAWSRARQLLIGLLVALTPLAIYLGGVVNPSALEVATAMCFWTTASILFFERSEDPSRKLVVLCAVSVCCFAALRSISPLWIALAGLVVIGLSERRALANLAARRDMRIAVGIFSIVLILSLAWTFGEHALLVAGPANHKFIVPHKVSMSTILQASFAHNDFYVPTMIGVFGSFDTFSPTLTYALWYGLIGVVVLGAAVLARHRQVAVLAAFVLAILIVPVLISSSQVHRYGYTWNGRDTLPFAIGLPIVASALYGARGCSMIRTRLTGVIATIAGLAQFAAFYEALRRYTVGTNGPGFGFLIHPLWHPPLPALVLVLVEAAIVVVLGLLARRAMQAAAAPAGVAVDAPGGATRPE